MALKFYLLALLIVTYFAQGLNAETKDNAQTRGLNDGIKTLIEKVMELVKTTINSLKMVAKHLYEFLQEQAQEEVRKAIKLLIEIKDQALEAIKKISEKAAGLGKEAEKCVVSRKQEITDLLNFAKRETFNCVGIAKDNIDEIVVNVENVVKMSIKSVSDILNEFKKCEKIVCQIVAVSKGISVVTDIRVKVENVLTEARKAVGTEIHEMMKCSSEVGDDYRREAAIMIEQITDCLNGIEL